MTIANELDIQIMNFYSFVLLLIGLCCRHEKIEINCLNSNSKSCHKKDPPPSQKYEQKTIEFGVFIDKWLYYQMGVSISQYYEPS